MKKNNMIKKMYMLTYLLLIFSIFLVGYTGTYFSDSEKVTTDTLITGTWPACPPYKPTNPNPENNIIGIDIKPTLSVYVSDPDGDPMDIYFYNAFDDSLIDSVENAVSNTTVSIVWQVLEYGMTYEWYAVAEDYEDSKKSDIWKFTTNYQPDLPTLISPLDNSSDIELSPNLNVQVFDQDNNTLNVSFYDASNNQLIGEESNVKNGDVASVTWYIFEYSCNCIWYIIVNDSMSETQSEIWRFTTIPSLTNCVNFDGSSSKDSSLSLNNPPISNASGPYYGNILEPLFFNGSSSYDSDGILVSYYWDFGDGTNKTEINATVTHQYTDIGIYNVTLTVTDNNGSKDTNATKITILPILKINNITAIPNHQNMDKYVNITCNIINTSTLFDITLNITYPNGNKIFVSIYQNHIKNTSLYYYNQTYNDPGIYEYCIWLRDINNNTALSASYRFLIIDLLPPEINNITITLYNNSVNITANISGDTNVKNTWLNLTYPDNTTLNKTMIHINNTHLYYQNLNNLEDGNYTFVILTEDYYGNRKISDLKYFLINN
jgi:PKD repeat protein